VVKNTLEMKDIVKRFPGVLANNHVNLTLHAGEIHALLSENGAGKSTLMQILDGFHSMDSGEILIDGERVTLGSPRDAIRLGIGMVHQEFMLVRPFTVAETTVLGLREGPGPLLDLGRVSEKLKDLSNRHGLALDPAAQVGTLPVGVQQRVEIVKLLYRDAHLLILDEPTAVLTPQEKDQLFAILRKLREGGRSVVIVTHKLKEVMDLGDRVTVMRDGYVVTTRTIGTTSEQELTQLMVGREVSLRVDKSVQKPGEPILQIADLCVTDERGHEKVRGISLEVHAGQILGIAGVDGNGQSELAEAIMHLREIKSGRVILNGEDVTGLSVAQHRSRGALLRSSGPPPCRLSHRDVHCRQCDSRFAEKVRAGTVSRYRRNTEIRGSPGDSVWYSNFRNRLSGREALRRQFAEADPRPRNHAWIGRAGG
jgi:simple sugar transport system ATP-binding protein